MSAYFIILLFFCLCIIPNSDSYYYWGWSQNLQLSYFDGPPLIAYFIRFSTNLFGNTVFAINFVGVLVIFISSYVVYKIVELLIDKSAGYLVALFWLTYPFMITRYILVNVTYDCLENLFNLLVLFFTLRYLKSRNSSNLYYLGVAAGFLLLSKYSGIIALTAILGFFIYQRELRGVFRKPHVYLSILICVLIFSPVIIWNYQHHFISFIYQLHHHTWEKEAVQSLASNKHGFARVWYYLGSAILGPFALCFLLILWIRITHKQVISNSVNHLEIKLILTIIGAIFFFWLCITPFCQVNLIYTLYLSSLVIIFTGYLLACVSQYRVLMTLIFLCAIYSIGVLIHFSLVPQSPANYNYYVGDGPKQLKFNSPLIRYIKSTN